MPPGVGAAEPYRQQVCEKAGEGSCSARRENDGKKDVADHREVLSGVSRLVRNLTMVSELSTPWQFDPLPHSVQAELTEWNPTRADKSAA
jgi:hypothetical protein